MPTNQQIQESLKPMFRAQELQRRAARTQIILNHIKLISDMTDDEKAVVREALIPPDTRGYWRKLWDALLNR